MWSQMNLRNSNESFGRTSKNTSADAASMVDKYLCDNNFSNTRSSFRNEASSLFDRSSLNQDPKSLLSLEEMLDEYRFLKIQNMLLNQRRIIAMQEKKRTETFWQGMQNALNTNTAFQRPPSPNVAAANANFAVVSSPRVCDRTHPGVSSIASIGSAMQNTFNIQSRPKPINTNVDTGNFSTPIISASDKKRKDTEAINGSTVAKKRRGRPPGRKNQVQGQNTLPRSSNVVNNQVVSWQSSSATLQMDYKESSHCISPIEADTGKANEKDDVSRKVNFDASNMPKSLDKSLADEVSISESDKEVDISDIDFSDLDCSFLENSHKENKKDDVRSKGNFIASNMPKSLDKSLAGEVSISESDKEVDTSDIDFSDLDWSFLENIHEDFSFHDPSPTHSNDNASSSRQYN